MGWDLGEAGGSSGPLWKARRVALEDDSSAVAANKNFWNCIKNSRKPGPSA